MKHLQLLAVFALAAAPALAQSTATVDQDGDANFSNLEQSSSSSAFIKQVGTGNIIASHPWEDPSKGAFLQDGSTLTAEQFGRDNVIVGSQSSSAASVYQNEASDHGDGNAVELIQANGASATIEQEHYDDGSSYYEGNIARLTQDGASEAFIRQDGGDNVADVLQEGAGHGVSLTQQGRAMDAAINQYGTGNSVVATQHNWNGTLDVDQGAADGASSGNSVDFRQTGSKTTYRSAVIAQDGIGNMVGQDGATFTQTGEAALTVTQLGEGNLVLGSQANGTAMVSQDGTSNVTTIIQN